VQVDKERIQVWYSREATPDFNRREFRLFVLEDEMVHMAVETAKAWVVEEE
jgi:hypothetical protein